MTTSQTPTTTDSPYLDSDTGSPATVRRLDGIACPPWCREHWASDERLGNPERKYQHTAVTRTFGDDGIEGGVEVGLDAILYDSGDILDRRTCGPFVYVAQTPMVPAAARGLAEHVLSLVEAVDEATFGVSDTAVPSELWSVDGLRVACHGLGPVTDPLPTEAHAWAVAHALNAVENDPFNVAYGAPIRPAADLAPTRANDRYVQYDEPMRWQAFRDEQDVADLSKRALLIRDGEVLSFKVSGVSSELSAAAARELARLITKPTRAERLANLLRLFAERAEQSPEAQA